MLRNLQELHGFDVVGVDAEIGRVRDLLFDDQRWAIRLGAHLMGDKPP